MSFAPLVEGKIRVQAVGQGMGDLQHDVHKAAGTAEEIELIKVDSGDDGRMMGLRRAVGKAIDKVVFVNVPSTSYDFVLVDGNVQPLIIDGDDQIWRIKGLGNNFLRCSEITPDSKRIALMMWHGADVVRWEFNFANVKQGVRVSLSVNRMD